MDTTASRKAKNAAKKAKKQALKQELKSNDDARAQAALLPKFNELLDTRKATLKNDRATLRALYKHNENTYLMSLLDPFTKRNAKIPDLVGYPSSCFQATLEQELSTDTNGEGAFGMMPSVAGTMITNTGTGSVYDFSAVTPVEGAAQIEALYSHIRPVSAGVTVEYVGAELNAAGTFGAAYFLPGQVVPSSYDELAAADNFVESKVQEGLALVWRPWDYSSTQYQPSNYNNFSFSRKERKDVKKLTKSPVDSDDESKSSLPKPLPSAAERRALRDKEKLTAMTAAGQLPFIVVGLSGGAVSVSNCIKVRNFINFEAITANNSWTPVTATPASVNMTHLEAAAKTMAVTPIGDKHSGGSTGFENILKKGLSYAANLGKELLPMALDFLA